MTVVKHIVKRLLLYKLYLERYRDMGFEIVYSHYLSEAVGISAVRIRKDFSVFGIKGKRRGGYNIDLLIKSIEEIFGYRNKKIIIVGMGNIGNALTHYYPRFLKKTQLVAGFDIDPAKIKKKSFGIPVYPLNKIDQIVREEEVTTAVIAVPFPISQEICDKLVKAGIKGILNFSPVFLKVPEGVVVNDINLNSELESLMYYVENT